MKPNYYVDNKKLFDEMVKHVNEYKRCKEAGLELPRCPPYIGECIYKIAEGLSVTRSFIGYTYRDEMIGDGVENTLRYLHNFNPEKTKNPNPFAYFTQIIYYAFLRRIDKEKKQTYVKYKITAEAISSNQMVDMSPEDSSHFDAFVKTLDYEKLNAMANRYEKKPKAAKKVTKKKGLENFIGDNTLDETKS